MPHYADGTEAKVGDQVTGKLSNSEGVKAGVIISITPGHESCNAMVQFTEAAQILLDGEGEVALPKTPHMAIGQTRLGRGEQHGDTGPAFMLFTCADYCDVNKLTKVS